MELEEAKVESARVSGISNVAYDVLVVLPNHLDRIAALQEYKINARDASNTEVSTAFDQIEQRY